MPVNQEIVKRLYSWRRSPLLFVTEAIQAIPSTQQIDGLKAVAENKRTTIRSGHGTGKDALAAWLAWWFMITRSYAKVVCTAPTGRQLSDILWSEMTKWGRKSIFSDDFVIQKDKIFQRDNPRDWWCRAISVSAKASKDEQAETLAGLHGDHLFIIVDESSGVVDPVYIPLEGALTQEDNKVLLIGNMTKSKGYFYDTHFHSKIRGMWKKLHWNSEKSSNVVPEYPQTMRDKYGYDSNVYRIRVLGEPPLEDDTTLIPLSWSIACCDQIVNVAEDEPLYLGVDVARFGNDESVILPRKGLEIRPWETFQSMNTITLGDIILMTYKDLEAEGIGIDEIGVGAGVTDYLVKKPGGYEFVTGINVANKSSDIAQFDRLRDELWMAVRWKCLKQLYSFPGGDLGKDLCDELASVRYDTNSQGGIKVESKREMKLRGVISPNIADALCLTEYFHNTAHMFWGKKALERKKKRKDSGLRVKASPQAWMAA